MRLERLIKGVEEEGLDAYLVHGSANIYYLTSSTGGGLLLIREGEATLYTPGLNYPMALEQVEVCEVSSYPRGEEGLFKAISGRLREGESVGYNTLPLSLYRRLREAFEGVELRERSELIWRMRRVKEEGELELMRRAGRLADLGMEAAREALRQGVREHEVAAEIAHVMMREGAEGLAFQPIVASGYRSAYPHGGVTDKRIEQGELVVVDIGATYKEYRSDITRTFIVGKPSQRQERIYNVVLEAHLKAMETLKPGVEAREADDIARRVISEAELGEYFIHSLGHGVGLEVHEPPTLSERSEDVLERGNVVTDEPGVYIPRFGGVRIEDMVLITDSGVERLTRFEKDLDAVMI
ncbi:MAG: peptidase M24 [Candidatus Bathyarchaeota archaeon B23]|nr:MAG: peptidase M24 [Candidatus Bathyarchaeota archaeon B23]